MTRLLLAALFCAVAAFGQTTTYKSTVDWADTLNPVGVTYKVDRADASDCTGTPTFVNKAAGLTAKTFVDQPLTPGKYCYKVTATVAGADSTGNPTKAGLVPAFAVTGLSITVTLTVGP